MTVLRRALHRIFPVSIAVAFTVVLLTACGPSTAATTGSTTVAPAVCADVIGATITPSGGAYRISVTVLSPDTGWDKYADAWEARAPDGSVLGTRVLAHPHVDEQPFTRSLNDVAVPDGVMQLSIAARDSVAGFCGTTFDVDVPGR